MHHGQGHLSGHLFEKNIVVVFLFETSAFSGVREQLGVHEHPTHPDEEGRGPLHHPETAGEQQLPAGSEIRILGNK